MLSAPNIMSVVAYTVHTFLRIECLTLSDLVMLVRSALNIRFRLINIYIFLFIFGIELLRSSPASLIYVPGAKHARFILRLSNNWVSIYVTYFTHPCSTERLHLAMYLLYLGLAGLQLLLASCCHFSPEAHDLLLTLSYN